MIKKIILVFLLSIIFISCGVSNSTPDKTDSNSNSTENFYAITTFGDFNFRSYEKIDAEYDVFLFTPYEQRKIYVGGKIPDGAYSDYKYVWYTNASLWTDEQVVFNSDDNMNLGVYYGLEIMPKDIPGVAISTDYDVQFTVGKFETNDDNKPIFTPSGGPKKITFKVAPANARCFNLNVYQSPSYIEFANAEKSIKDAFKDMGVITNFTMKPNIKDDILTYDWIIRQAKDDPLLQYAYKIIYPDYATNDALVKFYNENPDVGVLFYVNDYNLINKPITDNTNFEPIGVTPNGAINGLGRMPSIAIVFAGHIKKTWADDWENKVINQTAIHELGHLWCETLTDDAHKLWHNGNNKYECVMTQSLTKDQEGKPKNDSQNDHTIKILENPRFCEGHLQRGMNVAWQLKQYTPFGEKTNNSLQNLNLFASNSVISSFPSQNSSNNELQITIEQSKNSYIKGELIDILIKIKNNSNDTIRLPFIPDQHLHIYNGMKNKDYNLTNARNTEIILPNEEYLYLIDPLKYINYKNEDNAFLTSYPWYYWPEGNYDYYISYKVNNNTYTSNVIPISIQPVPDSLKTAFNELKSDYKNPAILDFSSYKFEKYEKLFNKYRGTFYEKEFFYKLLETNNYIYALEDKKEAKKLREEALKLYKEFILKYPESEGALYFIDLLNAYKNEGNNSLLMELSNDFKKMKQGNKLIKVLKNQKRYNSFN